MTAPNAELAWRVLDHIDAHPEQWNQGHWWCGTGGCFAGWSVVLAGKKMILEGGDYRVSEAPYAEIGDVALEVLGIQSSYIKTGTCSCGCGVSGSENLFSGANDREELGRLVAEIFGPRPGGEA
jgi:hypothetical protein